MAAVYETRGWKADDAVMNALSCVTNELEFQAVSSTIHSLYAAWSEQAALHLQSEVVKSGYPGGDYRQATKHEFEAGTCVFFVDGLRYDLGQRLCQKLEDRSHSVSTTKNWSTLPSVTASAKAAVTPVRHLMKGEDVNEDFYPHIVSSQKRAETYNLSKLIEDNGWQQLTKTDFGDPTGFGWCETGEIDKKGHQLGWKLARAADNILNEVVDQVEQLLAVGWKKVEIVTDHGFVLLPAGLPESKLPSSLAVNKWGRCAAIKPGANSEEQLHPWFWNPTQSFALASGISAYKKRYYTHGGLSVHECVTIGLTISSVGSMGSGIRIDKVSWKQLRCSVEVSGSMEGMQLDVRTHAGNEQTSEASTIKSFKDKLRCSVIVEDDDLIGDKVFVVILDSNGNALAQQETVVGGGDE